VAAVTAAEKRAAFIHGALFGFLIWTASVAAFGEVWVLSLIFVVLVLIREELVKR
jgi:hypothetical protein